MLNVRFDYGSIGRLFGVPRKFLSQVGAFCASFASGHQIIDVRAPAFPDPLKDPVTVGINEEQLKAFVKGCCSDLVDLDTAQTITGAKTIQGAALLFTLADASQRTSVAAAGITVEQLTGGYAGCKVEIKNSSLELWGPASTTNSAALDFHKYGDSGNYTARIIESGDNFTFTSTRGDIVLTPASGHVVRLSASPSDAANATTSKNVATCGWVAAAFSPQGHDHDSDYAAKNHNHNNDYAAKNHTHSNYAAADHTHGEYAALADFNELAAEVEDCVTQSDLTTALSSYSTSSDIAGTYAAIADVEDLAGGLEDAIDVLDALDAAVDDLEAMFTNAVAAATFDVVTDVEWTGTVLRKTRRSVTITGGVVTAVGTAAITTIDTPAVVTWS